jgi:hypothetical protein
VDEVIIRNLMDKYSWLCDMLCNMPSDLFAQWDIRRYQPNDMVFSTSNGDIRLFSLIIIWMYRFPMQTGLLWSLTGELSLMLRHQCSMTSQVSEIGCPCRK